MGVRRQAVSLEHYKTTVFTLHRFRDKMWWISSLTILWSIFVLTQSMNIGSRDGERDPTAKAEESEEKTPLSFGVAGRGVGRAAAVGHQEEGAGSQPSYTKPPSKPWPFSKPANAAGLPYPSDDEFADDLATLIKRWIQKHVHSQGGHCPSRPGVDLSRWSKCQCSSPAKYSPEGYGNCNFGAAKLDKRVWCYVDRDHGHDPRHICPDAVASNSNPGWYWSRVACIT